MRYLVKLAGNLVQKCKSAFGMKAKSKGSGLTAKRATPMKVAVGSMLATALFGSSITQAAVPSEITDFLTAILVDAVTLAAAAYILWSGLRGLTAILKIANRLISRAGA